MGAAGYQEKDEGRKQKETKVLPWILWYPWMLAAHSQVTGCSKKVDKNQEVGVHL